MQTSPGTESGITPSWRSTKTCTRLSSHQEWQRMLMRDSKGCWPMRTALLHSYMIHQRFEYEGMFRTELLLLHRIFCRSATNTMTIATSLRLANHLPNSLTPSQYSRAVTCRESLARSLWSCRRTDSLRPCHQGIGIAPSGVSAPLWMTGMTPLYHTGTVNRIKHGRIQL